MLQSHLPGIIRATRTAPTTPPAAPRRARQLSLLPLVQAARVAVAVVLDGETVRPCTSISQAKRAGSNYIAFFPNRHAQVWACGRPVAARTGFAGAWS